MKAGFNLNDASWSRVEVAFKNIAAKVPAHAARTMRRAAQRIVNLAQIYVPEDEALLRDSIRLEASKVNRRLHIKVVVGGQQVINAAGRVINLDQYAAIIHERYDEFKPGKRTQEKRLAHPGAHIGERFLTRAADDESAATERAMREAVTEIIKTELPR